MDQLMVTLCDKRTGKQYDIEVPAELDVGRLLDDIAQALQGFDPSVYWNLSDMWMRSVRMQMYLHRDRSLYEQGVWNGDYLEVGDNRIQ